MKYVALLMVLSSCSYGGGPKSVPINLKYLEKVTMEHDFYGKMCCTVLSKWNDSTYHINCDTIQSMQFDNGVSGIITKGCEKTE